MNLSEGKTMQILKREVIEKTAKIMGENSAAAMALEEAKLYNDPVFLKIKNTLLVTSQNTIDNMMKDEKV